MDQYNQLNSRIFSGDSFRPTPKCFIDESSKKMIIINNWGSEDAVQDIHDDLMSFIIEKGKSKVSVTSSLQEL